MRKRGKPPVNKLGQPHPDVVESTIDVQRQGTNGIKINFKAETQGIGLIHVYYAGKFVKTIRLNLTTDMEVK